VHYIGKTQGGTGTLDNVAYTFALFWAPISVLFAVVSLILLIPFIGIFLMPLLAVAALVINVYFAYLAGTVEHEPTRERQNLDYAGGGFFRNPVGQSG